MNKKSFLKALVLSFIVLGGITLFAPGHKVSALSWNCTPNSNWGVNAGGHSNMMAGMIVEAKTNQGEPLNVNYTLNSKLPDGYNYGMPKAEADKRIFGYPAGSAGRWSSKTFATGEKLYNANNNPNCNGYSVFGPGIATEFGNKYILDCGQEDTTGHGRSTRFWISNLPSIVDGQSGSWTVKQGANNITNTINNSSGTTLTFTVNNGSNVRLEFIWTPNNNWSLEANSYVNPPGQPNTYVQQTSAGIGQTVNFRHGIRNNGPGAAKYTWKAQSSTTPNIGSSWANNGLPWDTVEAVLPGTTRPTATNYVDVWNNKAKYTIPGDARQNDKYCERIGFSNKNGLGTTQWDDNYAKSNPIACVTVEGWRLEGYSGVSQTTALPGDTVTFKHGVRNQSKGNAEYWGEASYGWRVQESSTPNKANSWANNGLPFNSASNVALGDNRPAMADYADPVKGWGNRANYTIPSDAKPGDKDCQRIEYSNPDGPNSGNFNDGGAQHSEEVCVTVRPFTGFIITPGQSATLTPSDEDPDTFNAKAWVKVVSGNSSNQPISVPFIACGYKGEKGDTNDHRCNGFTPLVKSPPNPNSPISATSTNTDVLNRNTPISGVNAGDKYCTYLYIPFTKGIIDESGNVRSTSDPYFKEVCDTVSNKPYFKALGKGVRAGGEFITKEDSSCQGGGTLAGWNNNQANNRGASSELSAIALVKIVGFASAQTVSTRTPTELSFANSVASDKTPSPHSDSPGMGGNFGDKYCLSDVSPPLDAAPVQTSNYSMTPPAIPSNGSKQYNGNVTLNGGTLSPGTNQSIFVKGDVYIKGNITYDTTGMNASNVPSFVLKATGNIYINGNVTKLDGLYIAQGTKQNSGQVTKGKIFTCSGDYAGAPFAWPQESAYDYCWKQLIVRGSFVADQINLMRTYGSLRDNKLGGLAEQSEFRGGSSLTCSNKRAADGVATAKSCAAEVFDFSPEFYLSKPAILRDGAGAKQYDAITSLPPVL